MSLSRFRICMLSLLLPYCFRVCLALPCVMFIDYHVVLVVSLLFVCLPCVSQFQGEGGES